MHQHSSGTQQQLTPKEQLKKKKKNHRQSLQLIDNFLQVIGLHLPGHDFHHFLADLPDLLVLGIGGLADLVIALLGEAHAEEAQQIPIRSFDIHMSFNHCLKKEAPNIYHPTQQTSCPALHTQQCDSDGTSNMALPGTSASLPSLKAPAATQTLFLTHLPFFDHGAHFVPCEVHPMEVGQTIFALNILSDQFKFAKGNLIVLQISQAHFKYTALQPVRGNFCVIIRQNKTP